jgi:hypothetical protein
MGVLLLTVTVIYIYLLAVICIYLYIHKRMKRCHVAFVYLYIGVLLIYSWLGRISYLVLPLLSLQPKYALIYF